MNYSIGIRPSVLEANPTPSRGLIRIGKHFAAAALLLATIQPAAAQTDTFVPIQDGGAIYFLTPGQTSVRWVRNDIPAMIAALAKMAPNMKLEVLDSGGDKTKQQTQLEAAIANGAKGVILTAADGSNAVGLLQAAKVADVPLVGYAHDLTGADMNGLVVAQVTTLLSEDYHTPHCVSLGKAIDESNQWSTAKPFHLALFYTEAATAVGKMISDSCAAAFKPAVDAGKLKIVCEQDLPDYTASTAQRVTEQCLTAQSNNVQGISVGNDDQADGIYAALAGQGLAGDVKIYGGYDATLTGIQRVAAGFQDFDVYPPYKLMPSVAVQAVLASINKSVPMPAEINARYLEGVKVATGGIPAAFLTNTRSYPDNLVETVIADGLFTKEQICKGVAVKSSFCKE